MNLPPSARMDVAWMTAIGSRVDDILSGQVETVPGEEVFARLAERPTSRRAPRNA